MPPIRRVEPGSSGATMSDGVHEIRAVRIANTESGDRANRTTIRSQAIAARRIRRGRDVDLQPRIAPYHQPRHIQPVLTRGSLRIAAVGRAVSRQRVQVVDNRALQIAEIRVITLTRRGVVARLIMLIQQDLIPRGATTIRRKTERPSHTTPSNSNILRHPQRPRHAY